MPDQRPNNATDSITRDPPSANRPDALTETPGDAPGGGGLGGQSAAEAAPRKTGATAPNGPQDVKLGQNADRADAVAQTESVAQAADTPAAPAHPTSN